MNQGVSVAGVSKKHAKGTKQRASAKNKEQGEGMRRETERLPVVSYPDDSYPGSDKRGYPASVVQAGHHRAQQIDRQSALQTDVSEGE